MRRTLVLGAVVAGLTLATGSASAGISFNAIGDTAGVSAGGGLVRVTGNIRCSRGERALLRVVISQRATSAMSISDWSDRCTGGVQRWTVRARARGSQRFQTGTSAVCVLGLTGRGRDRTDAKQFCDGVSLRRGGSRPAPPVVEE